MINYFTNWHQTMQDAYNNGEIFLWAWSIGAMLLPFIGVVLLVVALGIGIFKLWEEHGL